MDRDRRQQWEDRHRTDDAIGAPSPFIVRALDLLGHSPGHAEPARALDVACGRGRHALLMAEHGYAVDAVDYALPALVALGCVARARSLRVQCLAADVGTWPLPAARYAIVLVVNFLDRTLFPSLRTAVAPGGVLLYETHRRDPHAAADAGMRPEFLLAEGELERACQGWHVLLRHDDVATHDGKRVARAGILARRPVDPPKSTCAH